MSFDPCNHPLKIWESIGTPTPKVKAHLGVWGFIPMSMKCDSRVYSWLAPSQALTLVTSLRLGLRHSPPLKGEVNVFINTWKLFFQCNYFHLDPWPSIDNFCDRTLPQINLSVFKFLTLSWQV